MNCARTVMFLLIAAALVRCGNDHREQETASTKPANALKPVPMLDYTLVKTYPHDITAFTEGLFFYDGKLYESTGGAQNHPQARSTIGIADLATGKLDVRSELDKNAYFGEGIVVVDNKLFQVTYTTQAGFIYDPKTFARIGQFSYPNKEGWGLTTDGTHIIMSDGTFNLTYLDPKTFAVVKTLPVTESGFASDYLNELEYVDGFVYANVWTKNTIVKIDAANGHVVGKLDCTALYDKARAANINLLEMNGIAYDAAKKTFLVTGKFWPELYEITIR